MAQAAAWSRLSVIVIISARLARYAGSCSIELGRWRVLRYIVHAAIMAFGTPRRHPDVQRPWPSRVLCPPPVEEGQARSGTEMKWDLGEQGADVDASPGRRTLKPCRV